MTSGEIMNQLRTHEEIKNWLDKYNIKDYTIRPDGVVDVNGPVFLERFKISVIPVQFGEVTGSFSCNDSLIS